MNKKYKHIFFDLDHTLWDFDRNSSEALEELYEKYQIYAHGNISKSKFIRAFRSVNAMLWKRYNRGEITQKELRQQRFYFIFSKFGYKNSDICDAFSNDFIDTSPRKQNVLPYAFKVLDYLQARYTLHIITNGFNEIQPLKLKYSGLSKYFRQVVTSQSAGYKKPDKRIFQYALAKSMANGSESIMVGDNLDADIIGAKNATIDQVYFNPKRRKHNQRATYEISCLSELLNIF